jgi:hypothetical protein
LPGQPLLIDWELPNYVHMGSYPKNGDLSAYAERFPEKLLNAVCS